MKRAILISMILALTACAHNPRPWTTGEKAMAAASVLAQFADTYTTVRGLDRGYTEMNGLMGSNPGRGKVIMFGISSQALALIISHYYPDARYWVLGGKTIVNGSLAVHNYNLQED